MNKNPKVFRDALSALHDFQSGMTLMSGALAFAESPKIV